MDNDVIVITQENREERALDCMTYKDPNKLDYTLADEDKGLKFEKFIDKLETLKIPAKDIIYKVSKGKVFVITVVASKRVPLKDIREKLYSAMASLDLNPYGHTTCVLDSYFIAPDNKKYELRVIETNFDFYRRS